MTGASKSVTTCWPGCSSASPASANRLRPETVGTLAILPASARRWATRRVPPAAYRCEARKRPPGFRSQMTGASTRSEEHTSELQSRENLVCRLLLEKKNTDRQAHVSLCCSLLCYVR